MHVPLAGGGRRCNGAYVLLSVVLGVHPRTDTIHKMRWPGMGPVGCRPFASGALSGRASRLGSGPAGVGTSRLVGSPSVLRMETPPRSDVKERRAGNASCTLVCPQLLVYVFALFSAGVDFGTQDA